MKKKVLIIANHYPNRSPGQRFRFEQYLTYLEKNGFECEMSYIISPKDAKNLYKQGKYFQKILIGIKGILIRWRDVFRSNKYDIIFIFREAFFTGTYFFEKQFAKSKAKIILDFDDAIWLPNSSKANKKIAFLKNSNKTIELIKLSDLVIVGNKYLAEFSKQYNQNIKVIPTTIDMELVHNQTKSHIPRSDVVIGWTGTHSTVVYLEAIEEVLEEIQRLRNVRFLIISDKKPSFKRIKVDFSPWSLQTEISGLLKMDIGLMPMPDDQWSKGKCGFKILQYASLGIPAVASPVGVNTTIIQDGENGFLAANKPQWIEKIIRLIDDLELRKTVGQNGQATVRENYSVNANKDLYVNHFNEVLAKV